MAAASLYIINYLQPVHLRLQPTLARKAVAGFMFLRVLVVGGAEVSVAVVWFADIGCVSVIKRQVWLLVFSEKKYINHRHNPNVWKKFQTICNFTAY